MVLDEITASKTEYNSNDYKITHILIDDERVELPKTWQQIAYDLKLTSDDRQLLSMHFDGIDSLYHELYRQDTGLCTEWRKMTDTKQSSKYRIHDGKLEYITYKGKALKPHVRDRAWNDKNRRNYYLCVGSGYVHRLTAQAIRRKDKLDKELRIHHRLIDETATARGNSLGYLAVLDKADHDRLHEMLGLMAQYVKFGYVEQMELNI